MTPKQMCDTCKHRNHCWAAYTKDHWCGNWEGTMVNEIYKIAKAITE